MPLNPAQLQDALLRLSTTEKPGSPFEAAQKIAAAYEQYCLGATAAGFPLAIPGPGRATMEAALALAFQMQPGMPPVVAQGYGAMVTLFWGAAVFAAAPFPGVAAPPVAVPALVGSLTGLFVTQNPAELYASLTATALDACTRSVLVTLPQPPPAPPLIVPVV